MFCDPSRWCAILILIRRGPTLREPGLVGFTRVCSTLIFALGCPVES
jgi:hypothetical protein